MADWLRARSFPGDDVELNKTEPNKYLEPTQSFLSMTKRSMYIIRTTLTTSDRLHIVPGKSDYLFVYPF